MFFKNNNLKTAAAQIMTPAVIKLTASHKRQYLENIEMYLSFIL